MTRLRILIRTGRLLARDQRIPKWLRVTIIAMIALPIPGPVDELAAVLLILVVCLRWPGVVREAWVQSRTECERPRNGGSLALSDAAGPSDKVLLVRDANLLSGLSVRLERPW